MRLFIEFAAIQPDREFLASLVQAKLCFASRDRHAVKQFPRNHRRRHFRHRMTIEPCIAYGTRGDQREPGFPGAERNEVFHNHYRNQ